MRTLREKKKKTVFAWQGLWRKYYKKPYLALIAVPNTILSTPLKGFTKLRRTLSNTGSSATLDNLLFLFLSAGAARLIFGVLQKFLLSFWDERLYTVLLLITALLLLFYLRRHLLSTLILFI